VTESIIDRVKYDIQGSDDGECWKKESRNPYRSRDAALHVAEQWRAEHSGLRKFRVVEIRETWTVVTETGPVGDETTRERR
jgi:hypothetical protein